MLQSIVICLLGPLLTINVRIYNGLLAVTCYSSFNVHPATVYLTFSSGVALCFTPYPGKRAVQFIRKLLALAYQFIVISFMCRIFGFACSCTVSFYSIVHKLCKFV